MTATVTDAVRSDRLLRSFSMVRETPDAGSKFVVGCKHYPR